MKWFLILLLFSLFISAYAYGREQLNLHFDVDIQYRVTATKDTEWLSAKKTKVEGIGAIQVKLNKLFDHRLIFTIKKPFDIKGSFKVRTPTRTDGIVAKEKSDTVQIILGPHKGCPKSEKRCQPIVLEDVGNIELRLDLFKAKKSSFGVLLFRPFSFFSDGPVRPSVSYEDKELDCGSQIESGWFIFASNIRAVGSPDTISLCIEGPDGDKECAEDREGEVEVSANQSGKYSIVAWDTNPIQTRCVINAI
jgi:hypothetical protein